jgi:hypothetical protein
MSKGLWRTLRESGDGAVTLAVDFGSGRAPAGFSDLTPQLGGAFGVWETAHRRPGADLYASTDPDSWVDEHLVALPAADGIRVNGILAYCSAAALALRLASSMSADGRAPKVILVDPVVVDPHVLVGYFLASFDDWREQAPSATFDPAAPDRIQSAARHAASRAGRSALSFVPFMETVCAEYESACVAVGNEIGLDAAFVTEMSDQMRSFAAYLVTSARVGPAELRSLSQEVEHATLTSAGHHIPPEIAGEPTRFDVPRARMLADPGVAAWITKTLESADGCADRPIPLELT